MVCRSIEVENFRNIAHAIVSFSDGVNVLYGQNAQGKTNLLEAVSLASVGRSFRGAKEADMIAFGQEYASVGVDYRRDGKEKEQNITMRLFRTRKRVVEQNKVRLSRMSEMIGQYRTVLFCPEHLSIVKEGPALRRNFLDVAISQLRPLYLSTLQRYNKVLAERNKLLKDAARDMRTFRNTIEFWSAQLADGASVIARMRAEYLSGISGHVKDCFKDMTGGREEPTLGYVSGCLSDGADMTDAASLRERYYEKLTGNYEKEIGAGSTLYGTHRDDIEMCINGRPARQFASQGQQRSFALALKLGEGEICREETGEYPVFLFDDVFSELDSGRRAYLCEKIGGKQMIMTSCEPGEIPGANRIRVSGGVFEEE